MNTRGNVNDLGGIHHLIKKIVQSNPDHIAVTYNTISITYKELDDRATIIASSIYERTNGENRIIGLCMNRSIEMVVGLLGILKAGCAYLPIDPQYPKKRIKFMVDDSRSKYILTQKEHIPLFEETDTELLNFENCMDSSMKVDIPLIENTKIAYVIYTSGSTGKPKGVPITHHNIISSTLGRFDFYDHQPEAFLLLSSLSFDSSKAGLFWTLCYGGNLIVAEKRIEQDMQRLGELLKRNAITHTLMLPSLYDMILEHVYVDDLKTLSTVIVAGEACTSNTVKKHFAKLPKTTLCNEYGPTEATVWCIAHKIGIGDIGTSIPIGKAVANAEIYLLDEELNQVNSGEPGEIFIGGPGLSGFYLNRPDLTDSAYIPNPLFPHKETKLYKTGDLARSREDGAIEFLGRVDGQIKIRGHRIEIDEIVKVLLSNEEVKQAVVLVENQDEYSTVDIEKEYEDEELLLLLKQHLSQQQINEWLSSIKQSPNR